MDDDKKREPWKVASQSDLELLRKDIEIAETKLGSKVTRVATKLSKRLTRLSDIVRIGLPAAFAFVLLCLAIFFGMTKGQIHEKVVDEVDKQIHAEAVKEAAKSAGIELGKAQASAKQAADNAKQAEDNAGKIAKILEDIQASHMLRVKVDTDKINLGPLTDKNQTIPIEKHAGKKIHALLWSIPDALSLKQFLIIQGSDTHREPIIDGDKVQVELRMTEHHAENIWIQWVILYEE
jgi:hypothetical protein